MHRMLLFLALVAAHSAVAQTPLGFRTDGTGRYLNATPPLHWGPEQNVIWKIELPQSNAIPVILGDKLLTTAEPCALLCIDKADGRTLWRRESSYQELVLTDAEKQQLAAERGVGEGLNQRISALDKESSALRKALREGTAPKEETELQLEVLKAQADELKAQKQKLTVWNRYLEPGRGTGGFHPTGGYSSPTPVTDGERIYVIFGNGLVACYTMDGERQWLKLIEHPTAAYGHGSSPLLVGDKLLVHFSDFVALNTKDGSEAWRVPIKPGHGTSMHARLGDEDVAIHPSGQVLRVSNGEVLAKGLGSTGPNSPLVQEGKLFFVAGQVRGYELPASASAADEWKPLWKGPNLKGGGYWFPSPILHDGLIYAMNASSIFSVVDAETGEVVLERRLDFGGGQSYPSITLAGKHLFLSSDNGTTLVLEPGREYKEVARNRLESFRSSLVFEGRRLYIRTTKGLWCFEE